ncbi:MAG: EpsI family protein [Isosphaeraceae bacterium]|nr:EpsI family protein [Isosphaeraceae bacterium]
MNSTRRVGLCLGILLCGVVAQAALEQAGRTERPVLLTSLENVPFQLGGWTGRDEPIDPEIRERAQTDDCLNRVYESPDFPGTKLALWLNYSRTGTNLRHSPEICLPSNGWTKQEADTQVVALGSPGDPDLAMTRLAYARGETVQQIGFLYYIFGEGTLENWVRRLPITSRSSHGRTTRGSSLTIEIFCPGDAESSAPALEDFARKLVADLESRLPQNRAAYYIP